MERRVDILADGALIGVEVVDVEVDVDAENDILPVGERERRVQRRAGDQPQSVVGRAERGQDEESLRRGRGNAEQADVHLARERGRVGDNDLVRCSGYRIDVDGKDAGAGLHELVAEHGRLDGAATTRSNDTVIGDVAGLHRCARIEQRTGVVDERTSAASVDQTYVAGDRAEVFDRIAPKLSIAKSASVVPQFRSVVALAEYCITPAQHGPPTTLPRFITTLPA